MWCVFVSGLTAELSRVASNSLWKFQLKGLKCPLLSTLLYPANGFYQLRDILSQNITTLSLSSASRLQISAVCVLNLKRTSLCIQLSWSDYYHQRQITMCQFDSRKCLFSGGSLFPQSLFWRLKLPRDPRYPYHLFVLPSFSKTTCLNSFCWVSFFDSVMCWLFVYHTLYAFHSLKLWVFAWRQKKTLVSEHSVAVRKNLWIVCFLQNWRCRVS